MKNYKIKINLVSPEMPKERSNKTGFNFMIFKNIRGKLSITRCYIGIFSITVTGSNPVDINRFRNYILNLIEIVQNLFCQNLKPLKNLF